MKYWSKALVLIGMIITSNWAMAQNTLLGRVFEVGKSGIKKPIVGAGIRWHENEQYKSITNVDGMFSIPRKSECKYLIVKSIGFETDTVLIDSIGYVEIAMNAETKQLKDVLVQSRVKGIFMSSISPLNTRVMTKVELQKAACCNLSESFETNPSVDVNFSDAATGLKQIQMLGLTGQYIQLTQENKPTMRVLSNVSGLTFVPGTWIESIQVVKGAGSVANGYESIAGQINVEEKKPLENEKINLNLYQSLLGRSEANAVISNKLTKNWSGKTFLHYNNSWLKMDNNRDGFQDFPLGRQVNLAQRFWYQNNNVTAQFGAKYVDDARHTEATNIETNALPSVWNTSLKNQKSELWGKWGYVFPEKKYQSIGFIAYLTHHENDNKVAINQYNAKQNSAYFNSIFQSIIGTSVHQYRTGLSFLYDDVNQSLNGDAFSRKESATGAFLEYTFMPSPKWNLVAGYRADYNNLFGWILTPRLHSKWLISDNWSIRASVGKGTKTANPISENLPLLFSSRTIAYSKSPIQEKAWNYGINSSYDFKINQREASLILDIYRTDFLSQVVVNRENANLLSFEQLDGKSYAQSIQLEFNHELFKKLNIRASYRFYDVRTTYTHQLKQVPLVSKNRVLLNADYQYKKWKWDLTANWIGTKRLPSALTQSESLSPAYWQINAQITYKANKQTEVYVGAENINNYTQKDRILYQSNSFDGTNIWGPIMPTNLYLGLRYSIM